MNTLPANAELAANAGTGPEGHKRSASVDSGASSDATMVASDIDWIDGADMGAVDGSHKLVATGKLRTSPPEYPPTSAAGVHDQEAHDAERGRVSTDTASGAPALATHATNAAGSPTTAAPTTVSINTATALAVADPYASARNERNEAPDAGHHEAEPEYNAPAAAAAATASSVVPEIAIAPGTPAPAPSAIVDHHGLAPVSASATAGASSALGSAASASATIDANPTSRGDAGCPETPVISRRSHAIAIRPFSIGRTSTPAPAPQAGGSKSAVMVANATSRGGAHCPPTPVVSRLPVLQSHVIASAVVNGTQFSAFSVGLRCSARSAAAPTPAAALAAPPTTAPAPAAPPMSTTALGHFGLAGSCVPPQNSPATFSVLRTVSRVIQSGMRAIRNALIALYTDGIGPTNGHRHRSTSTGRPEEDGCGNGNAPINAALLALAKRQRRRFL